MSKLVSDAINKYIHPTRYRQIVETQSFNERTYEEQRILSEDQKHSSAVAKVHHQKRQSRKVAFEGSRVPTETSRRQGVRSGRGRQCKTRSFNFQRRAFC